MSSEAIFGIIIAGVIILSFVSRLLPKRQPRRKILSAHVAVQFHIIRNVPLRYGVTIKPNFSSQRAMPSGFNPGRLSFRVAIQGMVQAA